MKFLIAILIFIMGVTFNTTLSTPALANDNQMVPFLAHNEYNSAEQSWHIYYVRCLNAECTNTQKTLIDKAKFGRAHVDIKKDKFGLPLLVYKWSDPNNNNSSHIRLASCNDLNCASVDKVTFLGTIQNPEGGYITFDPGDVSVAIDNNGNPRIINNSWDLVIATCHDPKCNTYQLKKVMPINASAYYGTETFPKMKIGRGNRPVFTNRNPDNNNLVYGYCLDSQCNNTYTRQFPTGHTMYGLRFGWSHDLALTRDGLPIIVASSHGYGENASAWPRELYMIKCNDIKCEEFDVTLLDTLLNPINSVSIALTPDGKPIVAYALNESSPNKLKLVQCLDSLCNNKASNILVNGLTEYPNTTLGQSMNLAVKGNKLIVGASGVASESANGFDRWALTVSCPDLLCQGTQSHKVHSNVSINTPTASRNHIISLP